MLMHTSAMTTGGIAADSKRVKITNGGLLNSSATRAPLKRWSLLALALQLLLQLAREILQWCDPDRYRGWCSIHRRAIVHGSGHASLVRMFDPVVRLHSPLLTASAKRLRCAETAVSACNVHGRRDATTGSGY